MELPHLRSLLFAPAGDAHKLEKAFASAADGVVCDLEDAVAPQDKVAAREVAAAALAGAEKPGPARLVRINGAGTAWFEDDLALTATLELDAIVLPKASPETVEALGLDGPPVVAIVETAMGIRQAFEIASQPRVAALLLGAVDLGAEVGLETRPDGQEILYARSKVAIDSAAAGVRGPFDVVHLDFGDTAGLEVQCLLARALGFRGKASIHPAQVETINRLFSPSEREVEWAHRVIDAFESQSEGVLAVNGTMVDKPVVDRARRILAEAGR
ncbi:MAG TPA: CoA ester lyase [Gaiellaceae bacterium]|nr:CoA ester lyase [Gaiellaceae bacterium]